MHCLDRIALYFYLACPHYRACHNTKSAGSKCLTKNQNIDAMDKPQVKDVEVRKDPRDFEHDEDVPAEIAAALKVGAKGASKSADVAMKLFENHDFNMYIDPEEEKKVIRKLDWIIIPMIMVNYIFFYIDKTTLSYAALYGMNEDLGLTGSQYSWLSSLFYFGFLAWAFPTNFMMQRFPLGKYLGIKWV